MAQSTRRRARARTRRQGGGTIIGFMAGLVFGLVVAVFVAIVVTRAPVPFVNKIGKAPERVVEPRSPADVPDPNRSMYPKSRQQPGAPTQATLPAMQGGSMAGAPLAPPNTAGGEDAKADPSTRAVEGKDDRTAYLLQAGAFRSQDDADGMRAKLALVGFEAKVVTADVNGQTLYRVRVGPYAQLEDMNRVRAKLAENGIEASVIRQR